jgi:hypothetical protein
MSKKQRIIASNKNSRVINRTDKLGNIRTETVRRDVGDLDVAVSTSPSTGSTRLYLDRFGREGNFGGRATMTLNGRQARTLFIALYRHFRNAGVPALY